MLKPNKHKETEIEKKGQLPITRNECNKRKEINENRKLKRQDKSNNRTK